MLRLIIGLLNGTDSLTLCGTKATHKETLEFISSVSQGIDEPSSICQSNWLEFLKALLSSMYLSWLIRNETEVIIRGQTN